MKKKHQSDLIDRCATIASNAQHIQHYVFLYETDDGAHHRMSYGPQAALVGLMEVCKARIMDNYRDYINHPKGSAEEE